MGKLVSPWVRGRGLERLLAMETNVSDLIQYLSERDPSPWSGVVGFVPNEVFREVQKENNADLLLTSDSRVVMVELKLGHLMSKAQQNMYEALPLSTELYLAALTSDEHRLANESDRWTFVNLSDLVGRWEASCDELARLLATEAACVLRTWDQLISSVFAAQADKSRIPLSDLNLKFLGRVVTRRIAVELKDRQRIAEAGVTSGGGLPLIQSWTLIRGEETGRYFMAEVRWKQNKPEGELRFGVDFFSGTDGAGDEEVRRAAYDLARAMDLNIDFAGLRDHLNAVRPDLAALLSRDVKSRPGARGDWEQVILHGMKGAPLDGRKTNNRKTITPDFYGDGTLRFQAMVDVDFGRASAKDVTDLLDATLDYLVAREPGTAAAPR